MKRLMYCLGIAMWGFSMLMSCKDDDAPLDAPLPALKLLTKIEQDGKKTLELKYNSERRLVRMNLFNDGILNAHTVHQYNNQGVQESRAYDYDGDLKYRIVYTLNNLGLIGKAEYYPAYSDFKDVSLTYGFSYDASGHQKRKDSIEPGEPLFTLLVFTYDAGGNRITAKRTRNPSLASESGNYEIKYTPGQKSPHEHWQAYFHILSVPEVDEYLWDIFYDSKRRTTLKDDGEVLTDYLTEASNQQFDPEGYLTQQTLMRTSLSSLSPKVVTVMTYEYTP